MICLERDDTGDDVVVKSGNCQALVHTPVPPDSIPSPSPKPKAVPNQKVQLGLGLTLKSHELSRIDPNQRQNTSPWAWVVTDF